jgi:tetratricopeptide (TPR) repeat protein
MVLGVASAGAQQGVPPPAEMASQTRQLFEAGQYQQVVDAAGPGASPEVVFIAALSHERLRSVDEASALARRLAERPDEDPWHFIGLSLSELLGGRIEAALAAARRATDIAPMLPDAHYQLGLVLTRQQAWKEAAAAFDGVTALDPRYGYAYYYAGLGHYRANRPDLMAVRFEQFLKLAPKAPERPEVLQIMRTIRGR